MSLKEVIYLIMIISISLEGHELSGQIWGPPKTRNRTDTAVDRPLDRSHWEM